MQLKSPLRSYSAQIIPRRVKFNINRETPRYWHSNSPYLTHLFTAFSLSFPEGEKFFIESVKAYDDEITDPELRESVTKFIQQEAQHSIQHRLYNEALLDDEMKKVLAERAQKWLNSKASKR